MTAISIEREPSRPESGSAHPRTAALQVLLLCGVFSSLLYIATDILGGLRYTGYSFTSQAISELSAIGAPSKAFVDPLFSIYNVLALLFGVGLFREAAGQNRPLRVVGAALIGYGALGIAAGLFGSFFSMQQRGSGSLTTDAPHIILTGLIVLLLLLAIAFGALALGRTFRIYSIATFVTMIVSSFLTIPFAVRISAGESSPGVGIIERIDVYASMLWLAVLSVILLRPGSGAPDASQLSAARDR